MYKKSVQGWLKHLDFMILDVVCLWISFTLAFNMRHGSLDVLANSLYRDMMWSLALMDIVVIFFFDSLKNVLKRGFYQEFVMTVKQTCLITLCSVFYLFTFKEAENYSRLVLGYTAALYLLLSYVLRCLWKNCLRKYFGGAEKRSLLIVTVSDIVDTVIDNIKNKNYGDYFVTGVCILDKKAKGRVIDGVTVVADEDDLVEYVCREWVDEVFINIPESEPYPAELLDKFIEMGVVVHMKLAKSQNLLGKKQFVEHLGTYTVLTTSINSVSRHQIILKRMLDILGGLAGCIITGILCIFVGPAIYIQSPGPIFFKQTRVGKNGKLFQMYKFRSMYMDAEERKAELMKENRVQDGMMFKLDFDPRIIGSKKLPDGTIKKGVGNFIRDWSLDEFPQFLNVLKGDMSLVGTRPPTVDEWDKYELHHRARLATKPGLTGMWQVSGRSNITDFEEVVKLDKQYIKDSFGEEKCIIVKMNVTTEYVAHAKHCKYSVSDGRYKIYNHKLYKLLLTDPPESMRDNIFEIDGTKYLWMLFEELEVDYDVYAFSNAVAYLKRNSYIEPTGVKGSYRVIKKKSKSVDESTEEFKTLNKELELKEMREKVKKCVRETYLELEKILDEEKPSVYGRNKHTYEDVTTLIEYMRKFDFIVEE